MLSVACSDKPSRAPAPTSALTAEPAPDPERPLTTFTEQASQVLRATLQEDHARMAELTHPTIVSGMGGKEKCVERLTAMASEMKRSGFAITDVRLTRPADLAEVEGIFYAVVPYDLRMTGPGGKTGLSKSFLVGVSTDGADHWKFVDGSAIGGDREKLKTVIKRFPDRLAFPLVPGTNWD